MCRICGRVVKCIFDTMPSRISAVPKTREFSTAIKTPAIRCQSRHISSRTMINSAFNIDSKGSSIPPPTFLLPLRANLHQAATQYASSDALETPNLDSALPSSMLLNTNQSSAITNSVAESVPSAPKAFSSSEPLVLSKSLQQLLPVLEAQKPHYITAYIYRNAYLLTAGDTLRIPFHLHGVNPGDILRFNRASIIGSRDYTLKAGNHSSEATKSKRIHEPNYLDERLFECRLRVMGVDTQPMTLKEKTKRRNRRVKTVRSKHKYTVLKVMEVKVKTLDELQQENSVLLLES